MTDYTVEFKPHAKKVKVPQGTSLLEASHQAGITINNLCGGDGICGRCKMIIKKGEVQAEVSTKLTREEIQAGYVLACQTMVEGNIVAEIPPETFAREKTRADKDTERFQSFESHFYSTRFQPSPLVAKVYLELDQPEISNNTADHQRVCESVQRKLDLCATQMGLKIIKNLPEILREHNYKITATVGLRREVAEVIQIEGGDTAEESYMIIVDMGTTTVVAHLVDATSLRTIDAAACFNSQGIYGREVTGRMISAEKKGAEDLQKLLVGDINQLINQLAKANDVLLKDIIAVVCAGNTAMGHFLLGLPTYHIRRFPYVPASVEPPPLRAAEVGIEINPRGLLYSLPGISGWVGSDLTCGILATGMYDNPEISLLVDIGTNGEIIIGNNEWLVACSASAGPALEGASVECGMRAESGAIERVFIKDGEIRFAVIGETAQPKGLCGSGIIDLVAVLLTQKIINRSGVFINDNSDQVREIDGVPAYILVEAEESGTDDPVYMNEVDIENIINAKAAIYAAMQILVKRLDMNFNDIDHFYIAGAFGSYINIEHAITIGLLPDIPYDRIEFAGNTSIWGAKIAAMYEEAFFKVTEIRKNTTYYDLMGADDYIDEFQQAMFLPHTNIELFPVLKG